MRFRCGADVRFHLALRCVIFYLKRVKDVETSCTALQCNVSLKSWTVPCRKREESTVLRSARASNEKEISHGRVSWQTHSTYCDAHANDAADCAEDSLDRARGFYVKNLREDRPVAQMHGGGPMRGWGGYGLGLEKERIMRATSQQCACVPVPKFRPESFGA